MDTPSFEQPEQKKSKLPLILGIAAALLCCCCLILIVIYFVLGPAVSNVFSEINSQIESPSLPNGTALPDIGTFLDVPTGGLGDDTLRANTWAYVVLLGASVGCENPTADHTSIDVLSYPDSSGVWQERWNLVCADGSTPAFIIDFTPNPNGGTDISINQEN